jgi:O-antigen/teichoic acid export membrane protein
MSGQAFSRVIQAMNTVLLVPILIVAWGVDGYGQWIALTALASYLTYSNFGLVTTSANEMVMASGANDTERARTTFQMSMNLTLYIILPLILVICVAMWFVPLTDFLRLTQINHYGAWLIIAFSAAQLWIQTVRGLMVAALYANGSYGFAYYLQGFAKLIELGAIALFVIFFHGSQVVAASIMAFVALIDLIIVTIWARKAAAWARFNPRRFELSWLRRQVKPTLGFFLANLSTQGLLLQGPRIILGAFLGGTAVAIYAIYGTAMRLVDQLLLMIIMPLEVEIALSVGKEEPERTKRLIVLGTQASWFVFSGVAIGLMIAGPFVFNLWTHGRVEFSHALMGLYLIMAAANLFGRVSAHALIGANHLYGPSFFMIGAALFGLVVGAALIETLGIKGMVIGGVIGEIMVSMIALISVCLWLKMPLRKTLAELFDLKRSFFELTKRINQKNNNT